MKKCYLLVLLFLSFEINAQKPYSQKMVDSFMARYPDSMVVKPRIKSTWDYEQGLILKAIEKVWRRTADAKYFNYILSDLDRFVNEDGTIKTYKKEDYNLDNINTGRILLTLIQQTLPKKEKYQKAAHLLWSQLEEQPKTQAGGYWHKLRYPNQMWLDGLFMAEPFSAEYASLFKHPEHFSHIIKQFELIEKNAVDPITGLIYHGYDESKTEKWADKNTGLSPHFWARAIGWYFVALIEVLDYFPENHPERQKLISYVNRLAPVIKKYQDQKSGVWYQMIAYGPEKGNYLEASSSCMFVYAFAKGARLGYLPKEYSQLAQKGYDGILKEFLEEEKDGNLSLNKTVSVGGLGGNPYRDGSFEYYLSEPIRKNDFKGIGPFIFASVEIEMMQEHNFAKNKTVALDYHFNREFRKNIIGQTEQYHYTWEDQLHSGFYWWGQIFKEFGAKTINISEKPTAANLKKVNVYIIVDPDTPKETSSPNFIAKKDITEIKKWVKKGGTLLLMANDTANCEIPKFNKLAEAFGIRFTGKSINMVQGTQWHQGKIAIETENEIFKNTRKVYIKELVTLEIFDKAKAVLENENKEIIIAKSQFGKGRVLVVGDPWLYNEYVDGRRIPKDYQNFEAARELSKWLLK
jgi:unsaturated rhamnogalacturonyl hydrolase